MTERLAWFGVVSLLRLIAFGNRLHNLLLWDRPNNRSPIAYVAASFTVLKRIFLPLSAILIL